MITIAFFGFIAIAAVASMIDWRRGWLLALLCGALQDPARKMTTGIPVVMTFSIVIIYAAILFAAQKTLIADSRDFARRFPQIATAMGVFALALFLAAVNGLFTFGIEYWKVPALSLFIYLIPIPAVILGYSWVRTESALWTLLRFYAVITSIALIGTPLEYFRVNLHALGTVGTPEDSIRYLPGIQIRMLSGFYRAPDIMAWHASMLTILGITMALRSKALRSSLPWIIAAGWGFLNCIISGRRKSTYMVLAFVGVFLWRYVRRLAVSEITALVLMGVAVFGVIQKLSSDEKSSVYTRGALSSREEIYQRLEGGLMETIDQFGFMGAGLGTATQGVHHLLGREQNIGWQEGGLGKVAVELGVPGLGAAAFVLWSVLSLLYRIASFPDELSSKQLIRVALFGIVIANGLEFMASAQAYSDPVLALFTAFLMGSLFATATLEEREASAAIASQTTLPLRVQPA